MEHTPGIVSRFGRWSQCCSDVKIWEKRSDGDWKERKPVAKRGAKPRYDLLCNVGGWPRDTVFARVVGWAFFARRKMSFAAFQKKQRGAFLWQVDHVGGGPECCCLAHLELCSKAENRERYAAEAPLLHGTVFRKPLLKRPASAL